MSNTSGAPIKEMEKKKGMVHRAEIPLVRECVALSNLCRHYSPGVRADHTWGPEHVRSLLYICHSVYLMPATS